jgi:transcriptional regulator with XRE-family HTH domain
MDFKAARERRELTLKQVSTLAGYSIPTINALELEGRGSDRLREKLKQIYDLKDSGGDFALRETVAESELEIWKRRAKAAEGELAQLKATLRRLGSNSKLDGIVEDHAEAVADEIIQARSPKVKV